jgi:hypothetical protein
MQDFATVIANHVAFNFDRQVFTIWPSPAALVAIGTECEAVVTA